MTEEQAMMRLKGEVASCSAPDQAFWDTYDTLGVTTGSARQKQRTGISNQTSRQTSARASKSLYSAAGETEKSVPHKNPAFVVPEYISTCLSKVNSPN